MSAFTSADIVVGHSLLLTQGECKSGSNAGVDVGVTTADLKQRLPGAAEGSTPYVWIKSIGQDAMDSDVAAAIAKLRDVEQDCLPEHLRIGKTPRPVFLLMLGVIGTMYKLRVKAGRSDYLVARLKVNRMEKINQITAYTKPAIVRISRSVLGKEVFDLRSKASVFKLHSTASEPTGEEEDADLEIYVDEEGESQLFNTLCTLVRVAQSRQAVLYIPFYLNEPFNGGAYFFDHVLEVCGFNGPIIVSAPTDVVAFKAEDVAAPVENLSIAGEAVTLGRWPCLRRTTHFVGCTAGRNSAWHTGILLGRQIDMKVSRLLSGRDELGGVPPLQNGGPEGDSENEKKPAIAFAVNGGKSVLWQLAAAAQARLPMLVLEGSGRLCNVLPRVWVRRSTKDFNFKEEADAIMTQCGFLGAGDEYGHLIQQVLRGRVLIHNITARNTVLERVLQREFGFREQCFEEARDRCLEYHLSAERFELPSLLLHMTYLIGAIVITLLTVVHEQYMDTSDGLRYILAVLPVLLSVCVSLRKDLDHSAKATAFLYGAVLSEKHLWQYCTQTGPYSSTALYDQADRGRAADDVPTARAELLLREIANIERTIIHRDTTIRTPKTKIRAPRATEPESESRQEQAPRDVREKSPGTLVGATTSMDLTTRQREQGTRRPLPEGKGAGTKVISTLEVSNRVHKFFHRVPERPIYKNIGDTYVRKRLKARLIEQQRLESALQVRLVALKTFTYLAGAAGSILALLGQSPYVAVTTALTTSVAAWDAMMPLEERLRRLRASSRELSSISLSWDAKNDDKEWQETCDVLVEGTERAILNGTPSPPAADVLSMRREEAV